VLDRTGDKLKAKKLASECDVPVLKAMTTPTGSADDVRAFASQVGYPLMVKAVDGGGGRGIRLVVDESQLQNSVERCCGESPSRTVFAEQAAVDGYKHIEVQIIGDGRGGVKHLWERDCSVQRRFQKIVELAPAPKIGSRRVIANVIDAAIRMARMLRYQGLGTWEFLVNIKERKFFFLEINPRLQVEHTISECIAGVDLVREQLLIAQGQQDRDDLRIGEWWEADKPPAAASIQLRLCAEDPNNNFALSIGRVADVRFPSGNGIRVDTHLSRGGTVGSDFDNLMAKIIVTAATLEDAVLKCKRALAETEAVGVKTNLNLLRAIVDDPDFASGNATTKWLENKMKGLVQKAEVLGKQIEDQSANLPALSLTSGTTSGMGTSSTVFRKGDAWSVQLEDPSQESTAAPPAHHLRIEKLTRNDFPESLVAEVSFTAPGSKPSVYKMTLNSTMQSADAASSTHRRGDPNNKSHIVLPMSGKLVEILVEEGDEVQENQVIGFVKQMKMELEIRSPRAGTVTWAIELENEDGDDVSEGVLLAELSGSEKSPDIRSRL
jgi:pyruvate carboxylase